jgi:hypothetical protein
MACALHPLDLLLGLDHALLALGHSEPVGKRGDRAEAPN